MQNLTFNLRREKFALLAANQMANLLLEMIELKIGTQSEAFFQFYGIINSTNRITHLKLKGGTNKQTYRIITDSVTDLLSFVSNIGLDLLIVQVQSDVAKNPHSHQEIGRGQ